MLKLDKNRRLKNHKIKNLQKYGLKLKNFQHLLYFFTYDPNMHRRSLSSVTWWNASSVDVKMESYVNKYGSTERKKCFANTDGCSIKWNNALKALEILLKLGHIHDIVKGNNIA